MTDYSIQSAKKTGHLCRIASSHQRVEYRGAEKPPILRAVRLILLCALFSLILAPVASGQNRVVWEAPQLLSDELELAGTPAVVADPSGNVHVMWPQRSDAAEHGALFYTRWDGQHWSPRRDVLVSPRGVDALNPDLVYTPDGNLHALWSTGTQAATLYYSQAPACCADDPRNWSTPQALLPAAYGTGALVADEQGRLHAAGALPGGNAIAYRRSDDGGATWPIWVDIPGGAAQIEDYTVYPRLAVDGRGRVHLVWSIQAFPGRLVMYARSDDGGENWGEAQEIDNAARADYVAGYGPNAIDVEAYGDDEIHLIWNGAPTVDRTHIWSSDGGRTWSSRTTLFPEIQNVGRAGWNDMVFDSAGTLHAVALGQPWSAMWSDGRWSSSTPIGQGFRAEWMRSAVGLGNQLHVVWLNYVDQTNRTVWYARGIAPAPALPATRLPVPLAAPVANVNETAMTTQEELPGAPVTPADGQAPSLSGNAAPGDAVTPADVIAFSVAPALLLVIAVVAWQLQRQRRWR